MGAIAFATSDADPPEPVSTALKAEREECAVFNEVTRLDTSGVSVAWFAKPWATRASSFTEIVSCGYKVPVSCYVHVEEKDILISGRIALVLVFNVLTTARTSETSAERFSTGAGAGLADTPRAVKARRDTKKRDANMFVD